MINTISTSLRIFPTAVSEVAGLRKTAALTASALIC
jgi:hypothetical protein